MKFLDRLLHTLEHQKGKALGLGIGSFVLVALGDYVTPEQVSFSVFYLVPISVFLWFFGHRWAWLVAVASVLVWPSEHVVRGDFDYLKLFIPYWEIAVRLGFYAVFILSLSTIRKNITQMLEVNNELRAALAEVKQLRGMLPICSSCKRIRDDSQQWVVLEKYIQTHTEATFTHGLCPDCMKVLYPDYYEKRLKGEE